MYPFPVDNGWDDRIVAFPVTTNEPPVVTSPASHVAVEIMVEFAVPAEPAVVLPTTLYRLVAVLLSLSFLSFLSNLKCSQNSTELTKKPSNGPVLHSYGLSSVGYGL